MYPHIKNQAITNAKFDIKININGVKLLNLKQNKTKKKSHNGDIHELLKERAVKNMLSWFKEPSF